MCKKLIIILLFMFILAGLFIRPLFSAKSQSYGLIIGINYKGTDMELAGAVPGATLMKEMLENKFQVEQITTLIEDQATRKNIARELSNLTKKAKPGDKVVIYYAGHGRRINDDNGDEVDQLDEVLVPYDFNMEGGNNYINDDDFNWFLSNINTDNITVIFDSCHSGSANRAINELDQLLTKVKITRDLPEKTGVIYKPLRPKSAMKSVKQNSSQYDLGGKYVFISAAMENELAFDGSEESALNIQGKKQKCGSFTSALYRVLSKSNEAVVWARLLPEIQQLTLLDNPFQMPVFQGDSNRLIFSSEQAQKNNPERSSIKVSEVMGDNKVSVNKAMLPENLYLETSSGSILKTSNEGIAEVIFGHPQPGEAIVEKYISYQPLMPLVYILAKDPEMNKYLTENFAEAVIKTSDYYKIVASNILFVSKEKTNNKHKVCLKYRPINKQECQEFSLSRGIYNWSRNNLFQFYDSINLINLHNPEPAFDIDFILKEPDKIYYKSNEVIEFIVGSAEDVYVNVFIIGSDSSINLVEGDVKVLANVKTQFSIPAGCGESGRTFVKTLISREALQFSEKISSEEVVAKLIGLKNKTVLGGKELVALSVWADDLKVFNVTE